MTLEKEVSIYSIKLAYVYFKKGFIREVTYKLNPGI